MRDGSDSQASGELWRAVGFAIIFLLPAAPAPAQTDSDIYSLIETYRPLATAIVVDGNPSDWSLLPSRSDAAEFPADPDRDLVTIAIAPLDSELLVLAEVVGTPISTASTYTVTLDYTGGPRADIHVSLDPSTGTHDLTAFDDFGTVLVSTSVTGLQVGIGANHIEISIPYAPLIPLLPTQLADALEPANHRSWVRASVLSFSSPATQVDSGAPVGSYRWIATPYALDPPLPTGLPNPAGPPVLLEFPLQGQWMIFQGADGPFSHGGTWAWDWMRVTSEFLPSDPPGSSVNEDYLAFGEPFFAPAAGTVTVAVGIHPDNTPGVFNPSDPINEVRLDIGGGVEVRMGHARQGSVMVVPSQVVDSSTPLAEVGNSGFSALPHLHLDALTVGTNRVAHPDVLVGLNPDANDPWVRRIGLWEPRMGFVVERVPIAVPITSTPFLIALALLLLTFPLRARSSPQRFWARS